MSSAALVINAFHDLFYNSGQWASDTKWMGVPAQKCPLDLWVYQEIIYETRPDLIVETGTCYGGSSLFLAQMCALIGNGSVVTIDIKDGVRPVHERVSYLTGSSISQDIVREVSRRASPAKSVMVILDSDHSRDYVIEEMRCYAPLVTRGSYLIVEDTDVNGHPICPNHGPGPSEAVAVFLETNSEFEVDTSREKFMLTQNPGGYLRRVKP